MSTRYEKKIQEARRDNLLSLCDKLKSVNYKDEQSIRDFYFWCLQVRKDGFYYALDMFKKLFPSTFIKMQGILNKRTLIKRDIELMQSLGFGRVYFGALTFDNELDVKSEKNKRKMAQRFLDKFMPLYEIIEEYGSENGRYHIHFLGLMEEGKTYQEFHNAWKSYSYIEPLKSVKKASKYLCDYVTKQVPRIRRNKGLQEYIKGTNQSAMLKSLIDTVSELPF